MDKLILTGMQTLSSNDLLECYTKALNDLPDEDRENVTEIFDQLMTFRNMGVTSVWELIFKLGVYFKNGTQKIKVER